MKDERKKNSIRIIFLRLVVLLFTLIVIELFIYILSGSYFAYRVSTLHSPDDLVYMEKAIFHMKSVTSDLLGPLISIFGVLVAALIKVWNFPH